MRPNYTYNAVVPVTRNEFISAVSAQNEVIVIKHTLLKEITKEINSQISSKKQGGFFKKIAVPMAILSWSNPIGWILSGITFLCGVFESASDDLKKYVIYSGCDALGNQILVLHHKSKVNLSYDKVIYPANIKSVDYKKTNKRIKIK